jgi:hypothetical protein
MKGEFTWRTQGQATEEMFQTDIMQHIYRLKKKKKKKGWLWVHPTSYPMGNGDPFSGGKAAGA